MGVVGWVRGCSYAFLWYSSILMSFFFLYCPLLPLLFISLPLYRQLVEVFFIHWEKYPTALLELLFGVRVFVSGDVINPNERSILLLNHRTRVDWNFLWAGLQHFVDPPRSKCKFVLKSEVRTIPAIGWTMQVACFLYINRKWEQDQHLLSAVLDYFRDINNTYQVLLFPEGTDLNDESLSRSNQYARSHGLKTFRYVLHPRTTGFVYLVTKMRNNGQLDAVYDLTVGYPLTLPQSEKDMARGKIPEEVHFHVRRYDESSIPRGEASLRQWCQDQWVEKEQRLHKFYRNRSFSKNNRRPLRTSKYFLYLLAWTTFSLGGYYIIYAFFYAKLWAVVHIALFYVISKYTDGIQHLEIALHNMQKKKKSRKK